VAEERAEPLDVGEEWMDALGGLRLLLGFYVGELLLCVGGRAGQDAECGCKPRAGVLDLTQLGEEDLGVVDDGIARGRTARALDWRPGGVLADLQDDVAEGGRGRVDVEGLGGVVASA
jgi:hypothetical protein